MIGGVEFNGVDTAGCPDAEPLAPALDGPGGVDILDWGWLECQERWRSEEGSEGFKSVELADDLKCGKCSQIHGKLPVLHTDVPHSKEAAASHRTQSTATECPSRLPFSFSMDSSRLTFPALNFRPLYESHPNLDLINPRASASETMKSKNSFPIRKWVGGSPLSKAHTHSQ